MASVFPLAQEKMAVNMWFMKKEHKLVSSENR